MKDWSKTNSLNTEYGSYVYVSEVKSPWDFNIKKLTFFKNALAHHDQKSLLMISTEQGDTFIEVENHKLRDFLDKVQSSASSTRR